jgi:hypothetical protein
MRHTDMPTRATRTVAALAAAVLALALTGGCGSKAGTKTDVKKMREIAAEVQTALTQRPDVATAEITYQDNFEAPGSVAAAVKVKANADPESVADDTVRLIWQSRLNPLNTILISVVDVENVQRGTTRHVIAAKEKSDLDRKYGPRPAK